MQRVFKKDGRGGVVSISFFLIKFLSEVEKHVRTTKWTLFSKQHPCFRNK